MVGRDKQMICAIDSHSVYILLLEDFEICYKPETMLFYFAFYYYDC